MTASKKFGCVEIINADYLSLIDDILPENTTVITDPPYGIGFAYNSHKDTSENYYELMRPLAGYRKAVLQYPEEMMRHLLPIYGVPDDVYAWCYNSNTNRQFRLWGFWGIKPDWNAVKQPAKNPTDKRVAPLVRSYDWCSDLQQIKNVSAEKTAHPCQIPVELVARVIKLSAPSIVLDPFAGSGTTPEACLRLNIPCIAIEKDPQYYAIACDRLRKIANDLFY